ncbi:MAG: hypothetical protein GF364_01050 [Candidatus Lokiarchaeota archaeon]|nr:hypothetical protein [Candidatus Lokiarchaeota archaeon]
MRKSNEVLLVRIQRKQSSYLLSITLLVLIIFLSYFQSFSVAVLGEDEIGGLIRHNIDKIDDGDGLEIGDFNQDGLIDVVIAESILGRVTWYEQGRDIDKWIPHPIVEGYEKIEGLDVLDADNDKKLEVIILDQGLGCVAIAEQDTADAKGTWTDVVLDPIAYKVQCSLEFDVDTDGDIDLIYAYEGLEDGQGGFFWLEFKGGESLNVENWEKHTIRQINGGWWINQHILDLNGDGNATEIVVTSRNLRNKDARPGAFWLEPTANVQDLWIEHVIEESADYYPLHITTGNVTGGSHSNDIVAGAMEKGTGIYLYSFDEGFSRSIIRADGKWHNVKALNLDNTGRDELILVDKNIIAGRRIRLCTFRNGEYEEIWNTRYWKADDRIIPYDIDDDGYNEFFTVSANDNSVDWWDVAFGYVPLPLKETIMVTSLIGIVFPFFVFTIILIRSRYRERMLPSKVLKKKRI